MELIFNLKWLLGNQRWAEEQVPRRLQKSGSVVRNTSCKSPFSCQANLKHFFKMNCKVQCKNYMEGVGKL